MQLNCPQKNENFNSDLTKQWHLKKTSKYIIEGKEFGDNIFLGNEVLYEKN